MNRKDHFNITVPKELKKRMVEHEQDNKVNWSKIACRAFEEYLGRQTNKQSNNLFKW